MLWELSILMQVCLGEVEYFMGDPHDNNPQEVVQFPRLMRNCMKVEEGFLQHFTKRLGNHKNHPKTTFKHPQPNACITNIQRCGKVSSTLFC